MNLLPAPLRRTPLALAMLCAIAGLSLTACKPKTNATSPAPVAAAPAAAPTVGIDLAGIDKAVQPGDDFYAYANGIWQQKTEIPADRASTGVFYTVFEKAEKRLSDLRVREAEVLGDIRRSGERLKELEGEIAESRALQISLHETCNIESQTHVCLLNHHSVSFNPSDSKIPHVVDLVTTYHLTSELTIKV